MKICVTKTLSDNVFISSIATSKFSEADLELMSDFGEPSINVGGDFAGTVADSGPGSADMTSGFDWDTTPQSFKVRVNGGAEIDVELDVDCNNLDEVLVAIDAAIADAGLDDEVEVYEDSPYVGLRTVHAGEDQELILSAGAPADALVTLGVAADTYDGAGAPDFTLTDRYRSVDTKDQPIVQRFDARDERFAGAAQLSADLWTDTIVQRIKDAMTALRAEHDTFSGENCETY